MHFHSKELIEAMRKGKEGKEENKLRSRRMPWLLLPSHDRMLH